MNRRAAVRKLVAASAGSFFARLPGESLPGAGAADQENYILRSQVRLVLLDVCVKDSDGGFVTGLTKDSFSVVEDGKAQEITVFDDADVPVTVGILVDESRSMTPKHSQVITAAQTLIEESNRQ